MPKSDTNLLREVLRQRQSVLLCSEVVPASGLILVNFPATNQDTLGEAVHDHLRNIEAGMSQPRFVSLEDPGISDLPSPVNYQSIGAGIFRPLGVLWVQ
ncbi:hypothetical protein J6590_029147 [Homalodisca vitripennis]|nr:hypothetical protein J6590_029147 [Homalodisca vitripennis]